MNDGLGTVRLTADWAVLGKHPGQAMGYDVLDGSLPADRAKAYLWGATTGVPDSRTPTESLPWRVFLGSVSKDPAPVCAVVETTWDGCTDGTGAPSYAWRLLLLEWSQARTAGLTWSALDHVLPDDRLPATGARVSFSASRTPAAELAATVDGLSFDWTARVAALLLDNRQVAITNPPGAVLPDTSGRVRVLDAICSLLPYGCRAWLSAATWTGQSEHTLRLVFAAAARSGQLEVRPGAGSPPEPQGAAARSYLSELLRLRASGRSTADLVGHLLGADDVVPLRSPEAAVRALREADLLESVVEQVGQGHGHLRDVRRVLELHPVHTLGESRLGVLVPFLAQRALGTGGDLAQAVLQQHWSPSAPHLLARDIVLSGSTQHSFERARGYLRLMNALETDHPGAFDDLFTALVGATNQDPSWTGPFVYMVENEFGRRTDAADAFLIRSREAGLAWLRTLLKNETRDLAPLRRLAERARRTAGSGGSGWLRFAGILIGINAPDHTSAYDADEFLRAADDTWRIALDLAEAAGRPTVTGLMWPRLREVAQGPDGRRHLLPALDRLVPPGRPDTAADAAADADLLHALIACTPDGATVPWAMPRLRQITDRGAQDAYASALIRRIGFDSNLKQLAVDTLLGDTPDASSWQVLRLLMEHWPLTESLVCDGLEQRLTEDHHRWLDLAFPEDLVAALDRRQRLTWLRPVRDFRKAARGGESSEDLARIIAGASPYHRFSPQLLDEITAHLTDRGPRDGYLLRVALDATAPGMGQNLYAAMAREERGRAFCERLAAFLRDEMAAYEHTAAALEATLRSAGQVPAAAPPPPWDTSPPRAALPPVDQPQHAQKRGRRWHIAHPLRFRDPR
ncbi:hypothetical protein [Streptomyces hiroshimensis]|uniref:Secreted protein n=1 Tax=Streptomyces hiroshimensis TaxID=66424 RepID=A0ABQ2Y8H6_9ACTN|nr:hypothetical protein [Streptomyces hiroshimensis]GGX73270.1 hypothetical protein GCM10010324_18130 [Streptomyces hiroshimensis]